MLLLHARPYQRVHCCILFCFRASINWRMGQEGLNSTNQETVHHRK